jgi:hypothetical protein
MSNEYQKDRDIVSELKYEGLASLIIEGQKQARERDEDIRRRQDDFINMVDRRFEGLEQHNVKQNGIIGTIDARVACIEEEKKYYGIMKWIDKHPKRAGFILLGSWIVISSIVTYAIGVGALPKLWELITKVT